MIKKKSTNKMSPIMLVAIVSVMFFVSGDYFQNANAQVLKFDEIGNTQDTPNNQVNNDSNQKSAVAEVEEEDPTGASNNQQNQQGENNFNNQQYKSICLLCL
jgi:hypothetical protein